MEIERSFVYGTIYHHLGYVCAPPSILDIAEKRFSPGNFPADDDVQPHRLAPVCVCVCVSVCGKTATGTEPAKRALIRAQLHKQTFREICPRRCIARVDSRFDRIILTAARDWHGQSAEITGL